MTYDEIRAEFKKDLLAAGKTEAEAEARLAPFDAREKRPQRGTASTRATLRAMAAAYYGEKN